MEITKLSEKKINMSMVKGDTASFNVAVEIDGVDTPLVAGDTVYFTVKKSTTATTKILQKTITSFTNGEAVITLAAADTSTLQVGSYVYDIQINFVSGDVKTIVEPSEFELTGEVTYD